MTFWVTRIPATPSQSYINISCTLTVVSVVVPIFKNGDLTLVNNYRPESLLCSFAKVFEKVIYKRVYFYLSPMISASQHGFLKGRSVESNLCSFLSYSAPVVSSRGQVDAIYFDMSKAFDCVCHNLLLQKLALHGFSPHLCAWFSTYLIGRRNSVRISDSYSDEFISCSGVPQGSILGPLIFLLFINDLASCITNTKIILFADDVKLFISVRSLSDCSRLQADIERVSEWCAKNRLSLNPKKTKSIVLSRKRDILYFLYNLGGAPIPRVPFIKDLGVFIDSSLSFNNHVSITVNAALRVLGMISRLCRQFSTPRCLLHLFKTLVRSRLEFGSIIWNSLTLSQALSIENIQKRMIRIVYDRYIGRKYFYHYETLLVRFALHKLAVRRQYRDFIFLHKVVHGEVNSIDLLRFIDFHVPSRVSRNVLTFYPSCMSSVSPLSRIQLAFNKTHLDIFLCSHQFMFYVRKWMSLNYLL